MNKIKYNEIVTYLTSKTYPNWCHFGDNKDERKNKKKGFRRRCEGYYMSQEPAEKPTLLRIVAIVSDVCCEFHCLILKTNVNVFVETFKRRDKFKKFPGYESGTTG